MNLQEIILYTNIMYLKASTDVKISTFVDTNGGGGWGCGSRNWPLKTIQSLGRKSSVQPSKSHSHILWKGSAENLQLQIFFWFLGEGVLH